VIRVHTAHNSSGTSPEPMQRVVHKAQQLLAVHFLALDSPGLGSRVGAIESPHSLPTHLSVNVVVEHMPHGRTQHDEALPIKERCGAHRERTGEPRAATHNGTRRRWQIAPGSSRASGACGTWACDGYVRAADASTAARGRPDARDGEHVGKRGEVGVVRRRTLRSAKHCCHCHEFRLPVEPWSAMVARVQEARLVNERILRSAALRHGLTLRISICARKTSSSRRGCGTRSVNAPSEPLRRDRYLVGRRGVEHSVQTDAQQEVLEAGVLELPRRHGPGDLQRVGIRLRSQRRDRWMTIRAIHMVGGYATVRCAIAQCVALGCRWGRVGAHNAAVLVGEPRKELLHRLQAVVRDAVVRLHRTATS
jgi:hypothetical protein